VRREAVPVDFGAGPADPNGRGPVPQQPGAASDQPAARRAAPVQAAPQVTFIPGQPMVDTNPSRQERLQPVPITVALGRFVFTVPSRLP
jgi:hypothetical protein